MLRGWGHEVFNGAKPSAVILRTRGAIVDETAYTIANPVACGAVKSHRDWPGSVTRVEARAKIRARGYVFFGAERVRKASPYRRAKEHEVSGALDPKWATTGGGKKAYLEEAQRYRKFQADYRAAWERWVSGDRDVVCRVASGGHPPGAPTDPDCGYPASGSSDSRPVVGGSRVIRAP